MLKSLSKFTIQPSKTLWKAPNCRDLLSGEAWDSSAGKPLLQKVKVDVAQVGDSCQ